MATTEEQRILDIKVKYEDAIYGIMRYKEKIDELKAAQKELKQQEKDGIITTNEYKVSTEAIAASMKEYQDTVRALQKELRNNLKQEQEQDGSLKSLRAQLSNATKAYDELSRAEREGAKGKELQKHINEITNELKLAEEQTQRYYRGVGNYYNSMLDLAADLQHVVPMGGGGGVGEIASGISNFANSVATLGTNVKGLLPNIKAFGSTLLGLATNPMFAALAGIAGAGMAFKWWFDYNKGLLEATRLTREFTGYTGEALETMRNSIAATADVMGKDFKDVLGTADALMSQYHLSGEEAMKVINDGFAAGADLSGNMLDKINQYAPTFHDAGIGAEQLVAILQQTRSGIFSDAGMDLITMASKKIREMASGTASSLDAIGISSKKVQKELQDGTKNTFDIIQEVAAKLKEFPNDSQQVGDALKNVFGKQGAAAGLQLIEQLDTMSTSLEEVKKQTGAWGDTQLENIRIQKELNTYMSSMFDFSQKGFGSIITAGKQFGSKVLVQILKGLFNTINYFVDWYNESLLLRGVIQTLGAVFRSLWSVVKGVANLIIDAMKQVGRSLKGALDTLEGIVTFDTAKAQAGLRQIFDFTTVLKDGWKDIKQSGIDMGNAWADGFGNTVNGRLQHLKLANLDGGATSTDPTKGNGGGSASPSGNTDKKKNAAKIKAEKEEAERQKKQEKELQAAIALIQYEYGEKVLDAKRMFITGMYDDEKAYQQDLDDLQKEELNKMLDTYVVAGKIGQAKAQEMQEKLMDIYVQAKQKLVQEAKDTANKLKEEFEIAERETEHNNIMSDNTEGNSLTAKLDRYKAFLQQKIDANQNHLEVLKELWDEYDNAERQQEEENLKEKEEAHQKQEKMQEDSLNMMSSMISTFGDGLTDFFNEQDKSLHSFLKAMLTSLLDAIEISINAYYAKILADQIASKSWGGVASAAALMAIIKAAFAGAKSLVKGFAVGGLVQGSGSGTSDSVPAMLSNGESVMTAKATSMFSPILSAFNQLGGGVPIVVNNSGSNIGMDMLAAAIAKGYQMAPRPVVSVQDIHTTENRIKVIEGLAGIS